MNRKILLVGFLALLIGAGISFAELRKESSPLVGIVIPHHDMVASARQAYLEKVSAEVTPETIVVLVPDHFAQSNIPVVSTLKTWRTILGDIEANQILIKELGLVTNEAPFDHEHGLTVLLKDFKQYFDQSKIVPIMVSRNATFAEVSDLMGNIYDACPECFVVASVDFSHTNTANGAALHDVLTLRELYQVDAASLYTYAEVDSPEALSGLAVWAQLHKAKQFTLFSHTNSGYLTNTPVGEMTTHIIGGYQKGAPITALDDTVTMMVGGDTMFARRSYADATTLVSTPFALLGDRFFWGVDIALLNLEGVFSTERDYKDGWNELPPQLLFSPSTIAYLKNARVTAVGMANNHTFDGGVQAADFSKTLLEEEGIDVVGYPRETSSVLIKEYGHTKVAVVALSSLEPHEDIAATISTYSDAGYLVVVYIHWGQEYTKNHVAAQEQIAKRLVDAGAKLIIGSHPHVVQDVGVYQGVPIIYSLGNFLFDQDFSVETQIGAVLGVKISASAVELFLIPIKSSYATAVLPSKEYRTYVEEWTEDWEEYRTEYDHFVFPYNKVRE